MKNTEKCPKCESADIARIEGEAGAYGSGNNIKIGMSIFSAIKVTRYVCLHCGFSEEWIEAKDIEKIRKAFGKMGLPSPNLTNPS